MAAEANNGLQMAMLQQGMDIQQQAMAQMLQSMPTANPQLPQREGLGTLVDLQA